MREFQVSPVVDRYDNGRRRSASMRIRADKLFISEGVYRFDNKLGQIIAAFPIREYYVTAYA